MDRRRDRRRLAHRTVAEPFVVAFHLQLHSRKDERDRRRRHQMLQSDAALHRHPLRTQPGLERAGGLAEGDVVAAAVRGTRDGQRAQVAFAQQLGQAIEVHHLLQQLGQRAVVEQRARSLAAPARDGPAHRQHGQPARAGAHHAEGVGTVDLFGAEVAPDVDHTRHREVEAVGVAGNGGRVDRAGRGAGDHAERVVARRPDFAADARHRFEHPHLVSRTRAPAREHEPGGGVAARRVHARTV
jgi:hypothetical protein